MSALTSLKHEELTFFQFFFWPVLPTERKFVLFVSSIAFFIWGVNSLTYPFQTGLLITAPNSGAEVLGFLRTFVSLPVSIVFVLLYSWLHDKLNKPEVVLIIYVFFGVFLTFFSFYIVPNNSFFIINPQVISLLMKDYPHIKWIFPIYGNWTLSIFYIIIAILSSIMASQLFWQTANHFTQTVQAVRLYPLFIVFSGLGGVTFAIALDLLNSYLAQHSLQSKSEKLLLMLQISTIAVIFLSIIIVFLFKKLYTTFADLNKEIEAKRKKITPPSLFTGFKYFFHSSYLLYILITLTSLGIIYELINVIWKSELQAALPTSYLYDDFLIQYNLWNGVAVVIFAYATKTFIYRWGWVPVAFMTPLISLIAALPFFTVLLIHHIDQDLIYLLNINPHYLLALLGAFQSVMMGTAISCLYHPTKEMAYIPLDKDMKIKGKAAADVLGTQCGLAGGGIIQEGLLSWSKGTDLTVIPQFLIIIAGFFASWFLATKALGKQYLELIKSTHTNPEKK